MVPTGRHGRGKQHGQFQAQDLANVLLSFGTSGDDVAQVVMMLGGCIYHPTADHPDPYVEGGKTCLDALTVLIQGAAVIQDTAPRSANEKALPTTVELALWPGGVTFRWEDRADHYGPALGSVSRIGDGKGITTITALRPLMFVVANALWLDTVAGEHMRDLIEASKKNRRPSRKGAAAVGADELPPSSALSLPQQEKRHGPYTTVASFR